MALSLEPERALNDFQLAHLNDGASPHQGLSQMGTGLYF